MRVILELLNQLFDCFCAIRLLLLDCSRCCCCGFLHNFPTRFGGPRMLLLLDQVDPVVHFPNSASVYYEATLQTDILCGITPPESSCIPLSHTNRK